MERLYSEYLNWNVSSFQVKIDRLKKEAPQELGI